MSEQKDQAGSANANDSEDQLRKRKLKLEIADLESKRRWYNKLLVYIPIVTTLVAVVGLSLTATVFLFDRRKERESRENETKARIEEQRVRNDNQIRNNIEQTLK